MGSEGRCRPQQAAGRKRQQAARSPWAADAAEMRRLGSHLAVLRDIEAVPISFTEEIRENLAGMNSKVIGSG